MATRLRKSRKQRGSRFCGWGQIGQHRASGSRGGVGCRRTVAAHSRSHLVRTRRPGLGAASAGARRRTGARRRVSDLPATPALPCRIRHVDPRHS